MNQRKKCLLSGFVLLAMFLPVGAIADFSDQNPEREIDHLLGFIEHSNCVFVRSKSSYSGARAREHIEKKYNYIKKRKKELSAEQFISSAASRSSLSQKPYTVQCGRETITSERWLLDELERYRQSATLHPLGLYTQ